MGVFLVLVVGGFVYYQKVSVTTDIPLDTSTNANSNTSAGSETINPGTNTGSVSDDDGDDDDNSDTTMQPTPVSGGTSATTGGTSASPSFTLAVVAQHATRTSCYSAINGNVYDLTSWIPKHPGGEQAILGICGKDGSAKFNGQHGGAALQAGILAGFKIGTLAK